MASKRSKKGPSKGGKGFVTKKYTKESPGALNMNYYVLCKRKDGNFYKASIIECRLRNEDLEGKNNLTEDSYDYYIHFENMNRRLDDWVRYSDLQKTQEIVVDPLALSDVERSSDEEHEGLDLNQRRMHLEATKVKTISKIQLGIHQSQAWYFSPLPTGYQNIDVLLFCEFCLDFFKEKEELEIHTKNCLLSHPPGNEIYRDEERSISMWEVDGFKNPGYCESLSYLSKIFLDHKCLSLTISPFLFFVLTENDKNGSHLVGYFSKSKDLASDNNLSCILTLPFHQRKGYGKFLINFSYELSKIEKRVGTPERPLSDLGRLSYMSFWTQKIIDYIREHPGEELTLQRISSSTSIKLEDITDSLERLNLIKKVNKQIYLCTDPEILRQVYKKMGRPAIYIHSEKIHWSPFKYKYA